MNIMRIIAANCDSELEQFCSRLIQEVARHEQNKPLRIILCVIISLSVVAIILILFALSKRKSEKHK